MGIPSKEKKFTKKWKFPKFFFLISNEALLKQTNTSRSWWWNTRVSSNYKNSTIKNFSNNRYSKFIHSRWKPSNSISTSWFFQDKGFKLRIPLPNYWIIKKKIIHSLHLKFFVQIKNLNFSKVTCNRMLPVHNIKLHNLNSNKENGKLGKLLK